MSRRLRLPGLCAVLASLAATAGTPVAADWLVLRDGSRVETKGAWQVKGKQVVFTQKDGRLAALRLVDVDLDASAKATAPPPAQDAPPAAEPARKKSVLVLTDKDVGHVDDSGEAVKDEEAKPDEKAPPAAAPAGAVVVESWERTPTADGSGMEIFGSLKNTGTNTATDITVVAKIYDATGALLGTADATLGAGVLAPNRATNFRATFPGILTFATARFEVNNRSLLTQSSTPPTGSSTR